MQPEVLSIEASACNKSLPGPHPASPPCLRHPCTSVPPNFVIHLNTPNLDLGTFRRLQQSTLCPVGTTPRCYLMPSVHPTHLPRFSFRFDFSGSCDGLFSVPGSMLPVSLFSLPGLLSPVPIVSLSLRKANKKTIRIFNPVSDFYLN